MVKKEIFVCDYCHKPSSHLTQGSDLPYLHGWRFLEEFSFKSSQQFSHEVVRKHFCSTECMLKFITSFVYQQEEQINKQDQNPSLEKKDSPPQDFSVSPVPLMMRYKN